MTESQSIPVNQASKSHREMFTADKHVLPSKYSAVAVIVVTGGTLYPRTLDFAFRSV